MGFLDLSHPFYRPAWRRYLISGFPYLWAGVEWMNGQHVWALVFVAIGAYLTWHLVIAFKGSGRD